jgi:hypothetical protein
MAGERTVSGHPWREPLPPRDIPVIIICHNMLSDLVQLVRWLEDTGHANVFLLDNASSYLPLLDYLKAAQHEVVRLRENMGHVAPWESGLVDRLGSSRPFIVSDPDILPDPYCPQDASAYFQALLLRHPEFDKAGFGLRIDDLPEHFPHRETVLRWEQPYWKKEVSAGVYAAHIDTTFAVHRPGTPYKVTEALRTDAPYLARHLPWYRDPRRPDPETAFYFSHRRPDIGYWNREELPPMVTNRAGDGPGQ